MHISTIGKNIKKLRDERQITQQQLAESIGVSYQAISKWECGITVPDTAMLPVIARYFDVLIDELFRLNMTAYRNKAERFMALYESDSSNMDVFHLATKEYKKLFDTADYNDKDLGSYAYLNECHARHFLKIAEEFFIKAIECGRESKSIEYYKNQRQYILFLSRLGRSNESIQTHTQLLNQEPDNPIHYSSLVVASQCANELENAILIAEKGLSLFPNDTMLLAYAGDTYKKLGDCEKAIKCWEKAFEIDPEMIDPQYSMALYFLEKEKYAEAEEVLNEIIEWNYQRGYVIENKWVEEELLRIKKMRP